MLPVLLLLASLAQGSLPVETLARQARDDFEAARYAAARDKLREALKRSPSNPAPPASRNDGKRCCSA